MTRVHSLIVGGTHGMGRVLVENWANSTHFVSVVGRRIQPLIYGEATAVKHYRLNLLAPSKIQALVKKIVRERGKINNLIFFQRYRDAGDTWRGEIETSLTATRVFIEAASRLFDEKGEKSIVVVGSMADHLIASDSSLGYHVAKAGLRQMVRYFAVTLASRRIRVNCVTPGEVLKEGSMNFYRRNKKLLDAYKKSTPLGRMAKPEDVSHAVEFLCSSKASFITGQNIVVDGGLSLEWQGSIAKKTSNRRR